MIPKDIAKDIASCNLWEDGDTWVIGGGKTVVFHQGGFVVRKDGVTLDTLTFRQIDEIVAQGGRKDE